MACKIGNFSVPDNELSDLIMKKKEQLFIMNKIIFSVGNPMNLPYLSSELYGVPSTKLYFKAKEILKLNKPIDESRNINPRQVKLALEKSFEEYGLDGWVVEFSKKHITTIYSTEKKITIGKNRMFSQSDVDALPVHEVGVHALRCENGLAQPIKLFALGVPGYLSTEEGLATYFEELTGVLFTEKLRNYAGRVISVYSVMQGASFSSTFGYLKEFNFNDDDAWTLTLRAHRGGGFIKDHVYLQGKFEVANFLERSGDLKKLFVGKVGVKDVPLVNDLFKQGFLTKPKYLPMMSNSEQKLYRTNVVTSK